MADPTNPTAPVTRIWFKSGLSFPAIVGVRVVAAVVVGEMLSVEQRVGECSELKYWRSQPGLHECVQPKLRLPYKHRVQEVLEINRITLTKEKL